LKNSIRFLIYNFFKLIISKKTSFKKSPKKNMEAWVR
jgi:hypothetical protein